MKITRLETIALEEHPRLLLLRVHTDEGIIGLGETYETPDAVAAWLHTSGARLLLGQDPLRIDHHWRTLYDAARLAPNKGVEIRAISAIDVALWDIYGQYVKQPVYQLLGGLTRDRIKVYNTCAGYMYGRVARRSGHDPRAAWAESIREPSPGRPYEDLWMQHNQPEKLAESLLKQGVKAMKIWVFDQFVPATRGQFISLEDLNKGADIFRRIRKAVGDEMEILVELHNLWNLPSAIRIAKALEEFRPFWYEDPVPMDNIDTLRQFKDSTHIPTTASETVAARWGFRELFEKRATSIAMLDVTWTGGISEAKKIATMAEAYNLPVAPHDCTGPVTFMANIHLCMNVPNAIIQEMVRAYTTSWYKDLVDRLPKIENGFVYASTEPGLGMALNSKVLKCKDAKIQASEV